VKRHIELEIADLVAGRLPDERRREAEEHVKRCDRCARELAWAERLRDDALREGLRHVAPMRIVEMGAGRESATDAERQHLDLCADCRQELEWTQRRANADEEEGEEGSIPTRVQRPWRYRAWPWIAAAAAAVAVVLILLPDRPGIDLSTIAVVEPLPVRITRDVPPSGSSEAARLLGLEAYSAGDWASARDALSSAAAMRPDDAEILLYLGSAELLDGDTAAAADPLLSAERLATGTRLREEASWQLANLALLAGRKDDATERLDQLAAGDGHRAGDAREMLARLR
jgi:anti-sigma factor RsiW